MSEQGASPTEHQLQTKWTMWYNAHSGTWNPTSILTIDSIEAFFALYKNLMLAGDLPIGAEYFLFREGIRPEWEDVANANGCRVMFFVPYQAEVSDDAWKWLSLSAIGETIENSEFINGVIYSRKKNNIRLSAWLSTDENEDVKQSISNYFRQALKFSPGTPIECISHREKHLSNTNEKTDDTPISK